MKTMFPCLPACLAMLIACSGAAPVPRHPDQLDSQKSWILKSWTADPEVLTKTSRRPGVSFENGTSTNISSGINIISPGHINDKSILLFIFLAFPVTPVSPIDIPLVIIFLTNPTFIKSVEPLMGWTGSSDTQSQVQLRFETKEEAILYAKNKSIPYTVLNHNKKKHIIRENGYGDNFSFNKKVPWTH